MWDPVEAVVCYRNSGRNRKNHVVRWDKRPQDRSKSAGYLKKAHFRGIYRVKAPLSTILQQKPYVLSRALAVFFALANTIVFASPVLRRSLHHRLSNLHPHYSSFVFVLSPSSLSFLLRPSSSSFITATNLGWPIPFIEYVTSLAPMCTRLDESFVSPFYVALSSASNHCFPPSSYSQWSISTALHSNRGWIMQRIDWRTVRMTWNIDVTDWRKVTREF